MNEDSTADGDMQDEYESVLLLDELESLLEEIEEGGSTQQLSPELRAELGTLGFTSTDQLRARIRELHEQLDANEG